MRRNAYICVRRLYVHSLPADVELTDVVAQIWRPVVGEEEALRLVWEKKLTIVERNETHVVRSGIYTLVQLLNPQS